MTADVSSIPLNNLVNMPKPFRKKKPKLYINCRLHVYKYLRFFKLGLASMLNKEESENHVFTSKVIDSVRSLTISQFDSSRDEYLLRDKTSWLDIDGNRKGMITQYLRLVNNEVLIFADQFINDGSLMKLDKSLSLNKLSPTLRVCFDSYANTHDQVLTLTERL